MAAMFRGDVLRTCMPNPTTPIGRCARALHETSTQMLAEVSLSRCLLNRD